MRIPSGMPQWPERPLSESNQTGSDDLNLRLLRSFAVAAQQGSFTAAAERLHLSQQAISNHLSRLEDRLGQVLFERRDHGVVLTRAGSELISYAESILAVSDRMFEHARGKRYPLRLAEIRSRRMIQQIWNQYRKGSPNCEVSFRDLTSNQQLAALMAGELDVAMHLVTTEMPGLHHCLIRYDPVVAIHVKPLGAIELQNPSSKLGYASSPGSFPAWQGFCQQMMQALEIKLERIPHDVTMLEAIGQGQIRDEIPPVLALEGMSDYPAADSFHFQQLDDIQPYYPWSLVWRKGERNKDVLRFVEEAQETSLTHGWLNIRDCPSWFPPGTEPLGSP